MQMSRLGFLAVTVLVGSGFFSTSVASPKEVRLLVKTRGEVARTALLPGATVLHGQSRWSLLKVSSRNVRATLRALQQDPQVEWVEEDRRIQLGTIENLHDPWVETQSRDPRLSEQWSLKRIGVEKAWSRIPGGAETVRVAVIDTGVDFSHPDLKDRIFVNRGEIPFNGLDDDGNGFIDDVRGWNFEASNPDVSDDFHHGTHVAGIIGATVDNGIGVSGIAPGVEILPVRWTKKGSGWGSDAIAAIHYAVKMGARIINASWGGIGYSKALEEAVRAAEREGVLFVASAGNGHDNNDVKPRHPANLRFSNVISVASTGENDQLEPYSNYGAQQVELGAPGKAILSTLMDRQYGTLSGTSMAAAEVSGVAALLVRIQSSLKAAELKRILMKTAVAAPDLLGKTISGGRVDADRASAAVLASLHEGGILADDSDFTGSKIERGDEHIASGNLIRPDSSETGALSQGLEVQFVRRVKGVEIPVEGLAFRAQTQLNSTSREFRSDVDGVIRDPGCEKPSLAVTVTLEAPRFVVSPGSAPYELLLNLRCGVAQKVVFEESSEAGQAIGIWQTLVRAERSLSVSVGLGFWKRQIEMIWPGKGDYYSGDVVNLTQGHYWDVVAHELGHAIYDQAQIGTFGGGQHYIDQCYTGALAFSEGWASFFSAWVNVGLNTSLEDPDAKFEYMVKRRAPIRFESIPSDVCGKSTNEWRVIGFLWDLIDTHSDGESANEQFNRLWKDLTRSRSGSVSEARSRLRSSGWNPEQLREVWDLNFPDERTH